MRRSALHPSADQTTWSVEGLSRSRTDFTTYTERASTIGFPERSGSTAYKYPVSPSSSNTTTKGHVGEGASTTVTLPGVNCCSTTIREAMGRPLFDRWKLVIRAHGARYFFRLLVISIIFTPSFPSPTDNSIRI